MTDKEFLEVCEIPGYFSEIDDYMDAIIKWLMLSSWRYTKEAALRQMKSNAHFIAEAFLKGESISDIAVDVGYCCG